MAQAIRTQLMDGVEITITPQEAGEDPSITIFHVLIQDNRESTKGVWTETFGSRDLLIAFLRGFDAGAAVIAGIHILRPEIPQASS